MTAFQFQGKYQRPQWLYNGILMASHRAMGDKSRRALQRVEQHLCRTKIDLGQAYMQFLLKVEHWSCEGGR